MKQIVKNLVFLALMSVLAVNASAQLLWDGTSSPWAHGTGTASDPYLIETPQNLAWLSDMVNMGTTYSGVYFKQTADFNMNGNSYGFNVIGDNSSSHYFSGHYDGDFKKISNLMIAVASDYEGLFGCAKYASLHGIIVCGISTSTTSLKKYCGAIVALAVSDTIAECCEIGTVSGHLFPANYGSPNYVPYCCIQAPYVGGLIGSASSVVMTKCCVIGTVQSDGYYYYSYTGGLIGSSSSSTIKCCYFNGSVSISGFINLVSRSVEPNNYYYGQAALLVGNSSSSVTIRNSYAYGSITASTTANINQSAIAYPSASGNNNNSYGGAGLSTTSSDATYRSKSYMQSASFPIIMNMGLTENAFVFDYDSVNDSLPVFDYQLQVRYYTIMASCDESKGSVSGAGTYVSGSTATLQASAAEGHIFTGWSDGNTENPRTITVTADSTFTANFTKNAYTIHVKQDCTITEQ